MKHPLHEKQGAAGVRPPSFGARLRRWAGDWLWVAPLLIFLAVFFFYPVARVIQLSLYDVQLLNPAMQRFVGIDNFKWLFTAKMPGQDGVFFFNVMGRTVLWVALSVLLKFGLGLGGASLLNQSLRGSALFRGLAVLPWGLPSAIAAMTWGWTANMEFGFINGVLQRLGMDPVSFLGSPSGAFFTTVVIDAWIGLPFMVIIMLAGLQSVPQDVIDAALVDGAGAGRRFRAVVWPQVRGVALTATLLTTVWTFNSFDPIWVLTRGGPLQATQTLPIAIYDMGFRQLRLGGLGKASAMSVVQLVFVSLFAFFYLRMLRRGADAK